jgi:hypothetical protein
MRTHGQDTGSAFALPRPLDNGLKNCLMSEVDTVKAAHGQDHARKMRFDGSNVFNYL